MGQAPITEFSKCGTVLLQVSNFLNVITILVSWKNCSLCIFFFTYFRRKKFVSTLKRQWPLQNAILFLFHCYLYALPWTTLERYAVEWLIKHQIVYVTLLQKKIICLSNYLNYRQTNLLIWQFCNSVTNIFLLGVGKQ